MPRLVSLYKWISIALDTKPLFSLPSMTRYTSITYLQNMVRQNDYWPFQASNNYSHCFSKIEDSLELFYVDTEFADS